VKKCSLLLLLLVSLHSVAQWSAFSPIPFSPSDSVSQFQQRWNAPHSALKATVLALTLPGAGQAYNRKYWKMPIVYGGLGTCVYFIARNTKEYRFYKNEYIKAADTDPNTVSEYSASQLQPVMETYHRWMDISYFSLIGVYALQALDANVDAHLFKFDISKDLSFYWTPLPTFSQSAKGITFGIQF
jgi:hypothetical protein